MRRILIIDGATMEPENPEVLRVESYPSLEGLPVKIVTAKEQLALLKAEDFATVFLHQSDRWAEGFAHEFPLYFAFSGAITGRSFADDVVYLPYTDFIGGLRQALERYVEAGGDFSKNLFHATGGTAYLLGGSLPDGAICFDAVPEVGRGSVFPLVMPDEGREPDYVRTLTPLLAGRAGEYVVLDERYVDGDSSFDGLPLLVRVRLSAALGGDLWKVPIVYRHAGTREEAIARLVSDTPRYTFLAHPSAGVTWVGEGDEVPTDPVGLDEKAFLNLLEQVPLVSQGRGDRHDLANVYGLFRTWYGLQLAGMAIHRGEYKRVIEHLMTDEYYWYALSLAVLKGRARGLADVRRALEAEPVKVAPEVKEWTSFLQNWVSEKGRPMRVLFVDDEGEVDEGGHGGWSRLVRHLFPEHLASVECICEGRSLHPKRLFPAAREGRWDLILSDLRLTVTDKKRTEADDPRERQEYLGLQLLRAVRIGDEPRAEEPNSTGQPTPFVLMTASENAWTREQASDDGADGYWIKESPGLHASDAFAEAHALELIETL